MTQRNNTRRRDWVPAFMAALERTPVISQAARIAGVGRSTVYDRLNVDAAFADAVADAQESAIDALVETAYQLALHGHEQPVYHAGKVVGHTRVHHERLIMFLLAKHRPEVYSAAGEAASKHAALSVNSWRDEFARLGVPDPDAVMAAAKAEVARQLGQAKITAQQK